MFLVVSLWVALTIRLLALVSYGFVTISGCWGLSFGKPTGRKLPTLASPEPPLPAPLSLPCATCSSLFCPCSRFCLL